MKLWSQEGETDKLIEKFTIGNDQTLDLLLAKYDVIGSIAHAKMLEKVHLISLQERELLVAELQNILDDIETGEFKIDEGIEDIHSQIEYLLTQRLGETGKKLHTARSRNDQVLLDLKLFFRDQIDLITSQLKEIIEVFISKSEATKEDLMPGYTHMQIGMVSSFGMWFGSFGEALIDDLNHFSFTRKIINQNPLGSAAGYGSSFDIDRQFTTQLLEFDNTCINAMYAQFTRGKSELQISQSLANVAYTLSKFAYDVCLFCNQNYQLIRLPDSITTGSSIMPQKKNPDVFELIRGQCNIIQNLPNQILSVTQNLPSGYHRDFQLLKEVLFPALQNMQDILQILISTVPQIVVAKQVLDDKKYDQLFAVDGINVLVQNGMAMRDAYFTIKEEISNETFVPNKTIEHKHIGSIGNLANDLIRKKIPD